MAMSFAEQAKIMQRELLAELDESLLRNNLWKYRDALLKFGVGELHDLELVPEEHLQHCGLPPMAIMRLRACTSKRPKVRVFTN